MIEEVFSRLAEATRTAPADRPLSYLCFGSECGPIVQWCAAREWQGIWVTTQPITPCYAGMLNLVGCLGEGSAFQQTLQGHHVFTFGVADIFRQFGGPFDLVAALGTEQARSIYFHECVQNSGPRAVILEEDGHNEEVLAKARENCYREFVFRDAGMLLLIAESALCATK